MHNRLLNNNEVNATLLYPGIYIDEKGDFLVATKAGKLSLEGEDRSFSEVYVKSIEEKQIVTIADMAEAAGKKFLEAPILETKNNDEQELDKKFLDELARCLPFLKNIFARPINRLHTEEASLLLGRVKKISAHADVYLANHPEDWQAKSIFGHIIPEKILSEERYDNYDIYENRLAVFLLAQMIRRVTRIRDTYYKKSLRDEQMEQFSDQVQDLGHWMRSRVCSLWNGNIDDAARVYVVDLYDKATSLLQKLNTLKMFPLSRYLSIENTLNIRLKITNILANDMNYCHLTTLWRLWSEVNPEYFWTEEQYQNNERHIHESFFKLSFLYVGRSLENLGWQQEQITHTDDKTHTKIAFRKFNLRMILQANKDYSLSLLIGKKLILRVVPVYYDFTKKEITKIQSMETEEYTLVLYPHFEKEIPDITSRTAKISCVPVSTMNILTIESIAREIRWFVFQYQLSLSRMPDRRLFDKISPILQLSQNGHFANLQDARDFYRQITDENIDEYCKSLQNSPDGRSLSQFIKTRQKDLLENLEKILVAAYFLQTCPICGKRDASAVYTWQPLSANCSCHTKWGEHQCGTCKRYYPYIKLPFQWHLQNVDFLNVAGRDMLCTYIKDENGTTHPQCPFCRS